mmetsp:Transcript_14923/g.18403  ORF Transcript_14923/g.18403 Transcript_14923/m.18403 type:complete len:419 (+) Transcript_14923:344-1600(+)
MISTPLMNIAGTTPIEDPEYRYKMPRLMGKVEGRGNGIKTAIPNIVLVAQSLHRSPGEVTKFFGCDLGAQTTWTEETERAIVNGAHTTQTLQEKLSIYIEKFVLCPSCKLPETSYKIKNEIIYHQCVACGAREPVDMQHKLTTFILKNHKLEKKKNAKNKDKKTKSESNDTAEKKKKKKKDKSEMTEEEKAERKRKKKEKAELKKQQEADAGGNSTHNGSNHDSDEIEDDDDDDDDEEIQDDASAMDAAVSGLHSKIMNDNPTADELVSEVRAVQTFCALPRNERAFLLLAALYYEDTERLLSPPKSADKQVLIALLKECGANGLICGLEKIATVTNSLLAPKFPILLKFLYDADVLEEQQLLQWYKAEPNRDIDLPEAVSDSDHSALLKATLPFIKWLEEADEEDDDDDDDDDFFDD